MNEMSTNQGESKVSIPLPLDPAHRVETELRTTFWISFFLGPFGLIPAAVFTSAWASRDLPTSVYWKQWAKGWAFGLAVTVFAIYVLVSSLHGADNSYTQGVPGSGQ